MENIPTPYQVYLSTSEEMQRSTQAVLMEKADTSLECIYIGEGTITDAWFIPATIHQKVQSGNVFLMSNPDDFEGGMYDQMKEKEPKL